MVSYWGELPNVTITAEAAAPANAPAGRLLQLHNGALILGLPALGSSAYIREDTEKRYVEIKAQLSTALHKGILIVGTPGIGKSMSINYLLKRLRDDHPAADFILVDHKRNPELRVTYFPGQVTTAAGAAAGASPAAVEAARVKQGSEASMKDVYAQVTSSPINFIILDQGPGSRVEGSQSFKCTVLVVSSADANHFTTFRERFPRYVIDTAWSRDEIEQCFRLMYSGNGTISADYLDRFEQLGGLPRFVFAPDVDCAGAVNLYYSKFPTTAAAIKAVLLAKDACSIHVKEGARMATFHIDAHFQTAGMRWVSDRVGERAMELLARDNEGEAAQLLFGIANGDERSAFGTGFESWAHLQLAKGGDFHVQPVGGGASSVLKMGATRTHWYGVGQEATVNDNGYGRPTSKQAESIDSVAQPDKLFQMTVSLNKSLKLAGLNATLANMRGAAGAAAAPAGGPPASSVTLYIAVPDFNFSKFQNVTLAPAAAVWPAAVKQPVMLVAIPMQPGNLAGHKRARSADVKGDAKVKLVAQGAPFPDAACVDELLDLQVGGAAALSNADMQQLATNGLALWPGAGWNNNWKLLVQLPAANPTFKVFRRKNEILYQMLK